MIRLLGAIGHGVIAMAMLDRLLTYIPTVYIPIHVPSTLGRSREASLGWDGPEERAGDAALILPA
jgi:hypothetical protein